MGNHSDHRDISHLMAEHEQAGGTDLTGSPVEPGDTSYVTAHHDARPVRPRDDARPVRPRETGGQQ